MMGLKSAQPKLYYSFSLDAAVPKDHFLRRLDSVVDFSFVRGLTRQHYSHTGKPSVDPVVLFKLNLLGYLFNISSERRLCQEAGLNLAWRWFLGYELDEAIPDHSVLSKARGRFGPVVYERFFRHIVKLCEARGLIQGDVLFIDSTLVKANASLSSQRSRALQAQLRRPESFVAELWAVNEEEGEEPPPRPKKVPGRPRKPESERDESKSVTNRLAVSCVDPDAQWVKKSGRPPGLSHKAHMMVDGGRAAIVTAVEVRPSSEADGRAVQSMLAKHAMAVERGPRTLVGDRGYSSELAFKACLGLGVEPLLNVRSLANRFGFQRERFIYNPERDLFVCPQGEELVHISDNFPDRQAIYRAAPGTCSQCPLKPQCAPGRADRRIVRRWDADIWDTVTAAVRGRRGRKLLRRRQIVSERIFADAKCKHGLERAQFRGRGKVQIQALLTSATLNLKKLAAWGPAAQSATEAGRRPTNQIGILLMSAHSRCQTMVTALLDRRQAETRHAWLGTCHAALF